MIEDIQNWWDVWSVLVQAWMVAGLAVALATSITDPTTWKINYGEEFGVMILLVAIVAFWPLFIIGFVLTTLVNADKR